MSKKNPVAYAEEDLGVHAAYRDAREAQEALDAALDTYASCAATIRSVHDSIDQRKYELANQVRGEKHDISQTALDRALKDFERTDDELISLRTQLMERQDEQEVAHAAITKNKYRLRVLSARMNELGGLLAFLASAKNAAAQRQG
jgi:chromosome segregation ATPase